MDGGGGIKHHILVRCMYSSTVRAVGRPWNKGTDKPLYRIVHTCFSGLLYPGSSLWILMSKRIQPLPTPVGQAQ